MILKSARHREAEEVDTYAFALDLAQNAVVWRPNDTHDVKQLVLVIPASEQWHTGNHLGEDATT